MIAIVPIPLVPPWTSSVSPSRAQPRSNTLCHTVNSVSGIAAASASDSAVGHRQAVARVGQAVFGIAAAGDQRADLRPASASDDAFAQRDDFAGNLQPGDRRGARRRRIAPLPLEHVGPVDPGIGDPDQHLAGAGHRQRPSPGLEHFGTARRVESHRGHSSQANPRV